MLGFYLRLGLVWMQVDSGHMLKQHSKLMNETTQSGIKKYSVNTRIKKTIIRNHITKENQNCKDPD